MQTKPNYRHLVVHRKGFAATFLNAEELHSFYKAAEEGRLGDVPERFRHLVVRDTITMKSINRAPGLRDASESVKEAALDSYKQSGVIVSSLTREHVPGGDERLPARGIMWMETVQAESQSGAQGQFMAAVRTLQERFRQFSDNKFALVDPGLDATLVTVAMQPLMAAPQLRGGGFNVIMEFYQITRIGRVESDGFEVYSDTGEFPIKVPSASELLTLVKSAEDLETGDGRFGGRLVLDKASQDRLDQMKKAGWRPGQGLPAALKPKTDDAQADDQYDADRPENIERAKKP